MSPYRQILAPFPFLETDPGGVLARIADGLPGTLFMLGRWLYDWQALLAGVLAILAARIWGRAIVRASELSAAAPPRAEKALTARRRPSGPPPARKDLRAGDEQDRHPDLRALIASLRAKIRATLTRVPCIEEPLSSSQLDLCRGVGNIVLLDTVVSTAEMGRELVSLRQHVAVLSELNDRDTCKTAWQALISLNTCARELDVKLGGADSKGNSGR